MAIETERVHVLKRDKDQLEADVKFLQKQIQE